MRIHAGGESETGRPRSRHGPSSRIAGSLHAAIFHHHGSRPPARRRAPGDARLSAARPARSDKRQHARRDRRQALAAEQAIFDKLRDLDQERGRYHRLAERLVQSVLGRELPSEGPLVEIGSGRGHLRTLVPAPLAQRLVHTEPTARGVRELGERYPGAHIEQASVEQLPFADGAVAAVLGLCVLDLLPDFGAALAELRRVLARNACVIHFLDQNPHLKSVFERVAPLGFVVFPNVFGDPCDSDWPDDLFVIERAQLAAIGAVLRRGRHWAAEPLAHYLSVFSAAPFPTERALGEFDRLSSDARLRSGLQGAFKDAYGLSTAAERASLGDFRGFALSSSKELAARLEREFAQGGFEVTTNEITTSSEAAPETGNVRYRSSCVGQHRSLPRAPARSLGAAEPELGPNQVWQEHGLHVLVARRR